MKENERLTNLKQVTNEFDIAPKKRNRTRKDIQVASGTFGEKLLQAGINTDAKLYIVFAALLAILFGILASRIGLLLGISVSLAVIYYVMFVVVEERAELRRKKTVPQLAGFIDSLAASLGAGFNIEAAVIQASSAVPAGLLRTELEQVSSALERGFSLEEALTILKRRIAGKEITSLTVAISLFYGMGGRMLDPFRRLARKIREQQMVLERANRDLVQVRLAFRVIMALSAAVPILILFIRPGYLSSSFGDSLGRILIQVSATMIVMSFLIFKRITRFRI